MEPYTGNESDGFLARRGAIRGPSSGLPFPFVGSHPRVIAGLIDDELDNLVCEAFDCTDTDDTFRGKLRAAMDRIQPGVLTSICAYRIGFEGDAATELSLLITVLPGSLRPAQAVNAIGELSAVLESYNERLGNMAIEIAEQIIETIAMSGRLPGVPSEDIKSTSLGSAPSIGSSIGPEGQGQSSAGTLGAFFRIVTNGTPQYFALTCNHVLSSSRMPAIPGSSGTPVHVVCPAWRDHFHWWTAADNVIKHRSTDARRVSKAVAQKMLCEASHHPVGTVYASSGVRTNTPGNWVQDWALIKLDSKRFPPEELSNIPLPSSCEVFERLANRNLDDIDWTPRMEFSRAAPRPEEGSPLFKLGRSTGHTVGEYHKIDASASIAYSCDGPNGKQNVTVKGKVHVVLGSDSSPRFAAGGDSGALVLNGHAEPVGLLTAVADGSVAHGVGYVASFAPILDNIKEVVQRGPDAKKIEVEFL